MSSSSLLQLPSPLPKEVRSTPPLPNSNHPLTSWPLWSQCQKRPPSTCHLGPNSASVANATARSGYGEVIRFHTTIPCEMLRWRWPHWISHAIYTTIHCEELYRAHAQSLNDLPEALIPDSPRHRTPHDFSSSSPLVPLLLNCLSTPAPSSSKFYRDGSRAVVIAQLESQ